MELRNLTMKHSERIITDLKENDIRYWASDNISKYLTELDIDILVDEATEAFESVLDSLIIDRENDPNSKGTARRLAKMYFYEIMSGRYFHRPDATAFPNIDENKYTGMLNVRVEIKSMCSHHHAPVTGVAYIGIIPGAKVIGLSKYSRIAQWCARRGTLQEELCGQIAKEIKAAAETENVGVYISANHGCCELRGIMSHDSTTQTTVLSGLFKEPDVKNEFFQNIQLQELKINR